MRTQVTIILSVINLSLSTKVTWLPNTKFNLPMNFNDGKLPCSKQTVIFPETIQADVTFEGETFVKGFILPNTGDMLLDGVLTIGEDPEESNCTERNKYFLDKSLSSWAYPDVWESTKFNEATPDAERVPCSDDSVEFPKNAQFSLTLPDITQHVRQLTISGINYDTSSFYSRVLDSDTSQTFFFNSHQTTGIVVAENSCSSTVRGCPCQDALLEIDCSLKYCPVLTCTEPIKPIGHCCKICGGSIAFERDQSFDLMEFTELVDKIVTSYSQDRLVYHIGIIPPNKVQLVIVEKGEYTGMSLGATNDIDKRIPRHMLLGAEAFSLSGPPLSAQGSWFKISISMFFAVVVAMAVIYVYYYKTPGFPTSAIRLPSIPVLSGRSGSTAGLLSRFDRRTESIVSLARRESTATVASTAGTAFRNPLYDSKRGRVAVVESVVDDTDDILSQ